MCRDLHFAASRSRKDKKAKLEENKNKLKNLPINEDVPVDKSSIHQRNERLKAVMSGKPIAPAESVVIQSPVPVPEATTSVVVEEVNNTSSRKRSSASETSPINEEVIEKHAKKKK